jgi:hypothetical protein
VVEIFPDVTCPAPAIPLKNSGTHKTRKNEVPRFVRGIFVFMGRERINFQVERVMSEHHERNPAEGGILFTPMFLIGVYPPKRSAGGPLLQSLKKNPHQ